MDCGQNQEDDCPHQQQTHKHINKSTMSKKKAPPLPVDTIYFPCPNPACRGKVFACAASLNKHFGAKPACRSHAMCLLANWQQSTLDAQQGKKGTALAGSEQEGTELQVLEEFKEEENDDNSDLDFPMADTDNHMDDFEDLGYFGQEDDEHELLPGYETTYTQSRQTEIFLLKLLTEMEAPLYAFEEIMKWARKAFTEGYQFLPRQTTYRSQIDKLETWMDMKNQRPEEVVVALPGVHADDSIKVTRFDFTTQLRSLLDDPVLNRDENLVINPDDPFQRYRDPDGLLRECLSGSWYNHAWDEMENDGLCDFMIPIILYIDKTQLSISGKLSIFPVQMSLGIFTEKVNSCIHTVISYHCCGLALTSHCYCLVSSLSLCMAATWLCG